MSIITDASLLKAECNDVKLLFDGGVIIEKLEEELAKSKTPGVGLAANQIGINEKVCIIRIKDVAINLVNPKIIEKYDLREFRNEGCLSFPNQYLTTKRYNEVFVKDDIHPSGIVCVGLEAVVVQHEIGHLYGETMMDYAIKIPGRNDKCWCDSGKKYKKCHLGKEILQTI